MTQVSIVIVAAGRGSRAGEGLPKQYRKLGGKMVLTRTIESFLTIDPAYRIQCVIHPDDEALFQEATVGFDLPSPVHGGATRQESVYKGLKALSPDTDYVLVHDAARPFVTADVISGVIDALDAKAEAVVPAVAITDTLKKAADGIIQHTVDRTNLFAVQTPQGFPYANLMAAHEAAVGKDLTDDGAVVEAAGGKVTLSVGDGRNFKLTTPNDFKKAEQQIMMALGDIRTGSGYDVHRFEGGDHVWLCGVKLPFTRSLKGHSDADVGLHALTDAILAALCDGDIGTHFPPSDNQWRGAPSDVFLTFARDRVLALGGQIGHVGVCLICEKPKIGPHKDAMRDRVAELLEIPASRVSVQATTTEKLGFTGREEGIAAQATATLRLPLGDI
ncbi:MULTISPECIES: bifunctional 2-C-methyl-D-erythritol 4-phosphate cytidylyltransferase/2-C-methyl-D-erythritol 2,4-cyclodiphosphate synthase [Kordiimonas]|uniref:bifunctional 2-C-methyl-D-erythritol 4-phosphate cytidylyltransferase/2-C-methyl-D-erythritol 2,4-cyclodiphosphate synthase n=1 Tax=Kordiimonas TaxID=288021 RepID=UPI00257D760C|nr:bifunctional 2-C-methyl-D-erythritol 4-phosphate cytidylyltransferase/2-C-methyl-D-erythritol 2,4-cyclodiphosphate synthase [Kordiimonas sp. UBA4487]